MGASQMNSVVRDWRLMSSERLATASHWIHVCLSYVAAAAQIEDAELKLVCIPLRWWQAKDEHGL